MSDLSLVAYIYFKGDCKAAMEFYKSIFGGELNMMAYDQVPGGVLGDEEIPADWLMHASLEGGDVALMASDTLKASPKSAKIELSLGGADEERMKDVFNKLSDGGEVHRPLQKEFWGDTFGNLTDKFGVSWMMNIAASKNE